jgi:hypothetical protein
VVRLGYSARRSRLSLLKRTPRIPDPGQHVELRTAGWRVAPGLQGALGTLDGRHGRGDDPGRNGRRIQGRWQGRSERRRCTVVYGASSPDFPSPPVGPVSRVSVRWAAGRTQVYIGR